MEHLHQAIADRGFQLGSVSCNLDLSVRIPRVAQAPGAVEGQASGGDPFDFERDSQVLAVAVLVRFFVWGRRFLFVRELCFPEDRSAR